MADMEQLKIPECVAVILDGNGRWAKKRGLPRSMGHAEGCKTLEQTVYDAADLGIKVLIAYGFSTENWKREDSEVGALLTLFKIYGKKLMRVAMEKNVRVRVIGERSRFPSDLIRIFEDIEEATKDNTAMTFVTALNYGGRDEIITAAKRYAADLLEGRATRELTEEVFSSYLYSAGIPDPELIIRTGGEQRISNFLLWQCAYSEFYYTDTFWPDFGPAELDKAIAAYNARDRRFGGVK